MPKRRVQLDGVSYAGRGGRDRCAELLTSNERSQTLLDHLPAAIGNPYIPSRSCHDGLMLHVADRAPFIDLAALLRRVRPEWHGDALCKEHPELNFFPGQGEDLSSARAICARCAVIAECAAAGAEGDEAGIWGGTTQRARQRGERLDFSDPAAVEVELRARLVPDVQRVERVPTPRSLKAVEDTRRRTELRRQERRRMRCDASALAGFDIPHARGGWSDPACSNTPRRKNGGPCDRCYARARAWNPDRPTCRADASMLGYSIPRASGGWRDPDCAKPARTNKGGLCNACSCRQRAWTARIPSTAADALPEWLLMALTHPELVA